MNGGSTTELLGERGQLQGASYSTRISPRNLFNLAIIWLLVEGMGKTLEWHVAPYSACEVFLFLRAAVAHVPP